MDKSGSNPRVPPPGVPPPRRDPGFEGDAISTPQGDISVPQKSRGLADAGIPRHGEALGVGAPRAEEPDLPGPEGAGSPSTLKNAEPNLEKPIENVTPNLRATADDGRNEGGVDGV